MQQYILSNNFLHVKHLQTTSQLIEAIRNVIRRSPFYLMLSMYCCMLYFLRKIIVKYFKLNAPIFGQADYCIRSAYSGELYSTTESIVSRLKIYSVIKY
jgi:hypothetical protein